MKTLTIELVKGQKQEFTFLCWKEDGLSFYATRMDGKPAVIIPESAYPDNCHTGEPYRFPIIEPLEIVRKRFNPAWPENYRDVLRRWRDAKLAEVEAQTPEMTFPCDALMAIATIGDTTRPPRPPRTQAEISRRKQEIKEVIEMDYKALIETPFVDLLDPIAYPSLLDHFMRNNWADEMGKDFRVMMNEVGRFDLRWHRAFDWRRQHSEPQSMVRALCRVQHVMRGDDQQDYHLRDVEVRRPTDREAEAYALMQQLLWGKRAPPRGQGKSAESKEKATKVRAIDKPIPVARYADDFSFAVIPQQKGKPLRITIERELQSLVRHIIAEGGACHVPSYEKVSPRHTNLKNCSARKRPKLS